MISTVSNKRLSHIPRFLEERWASYDIFFYGIAVVALWYFFRPYTGIVHDSSIYVGRALADLYPSTIGQQLSYVYDGQSRYSLAPALFEFLVGHFGPNATAISLTVVGLALWLAAAAFLLSRFLTNRCLLAALLCLCVVPSTYGGNWVFHLAEPFATPRLFAEAASLAAIGMLADARFVLAGLFLIMALLLHPIMAMPAAVLAFIYICQINRRWLWPGIIAGTLVVIAGAAGMPVLDRLFVFPDSTWLAIIHDESKQVILSDWYAASWSLIGCQVVTVGFACYFGEGIIRRITMAAAAAAAVCMTVSLVWPSLLVLQAQTWRALWLLSFFATALLPRVIERLWKRGTAGQAAAALLLAAWMVYERPLWAMPALVVAVGFVIAKFNRPIPRSIVWICWGATFGALEFSLITTVPGAVSWYRLFPEGLYAFTPDTVGLGLQLPILVGLAIAIAFGWKPEFKARIRFAVWLGIALVATISVTHWDRRSTFSRDVEKGVGAASLKAQIPSGSVFWLVAGDIRTLADVENAGWLWTGRPSWWNGIQGAGVVFDRRLAIESNRRSQLLREAGLVVKSEDTRWGERVLKYIPLPVITQNAVNTLCVAGGPDWIVAPLKQTSASVRIHAAGMWEAPAPTYVWDGFNKRVLTFERYLIVNCSSIRAKDTGTEAEALTHRRQSASTPKI